MRLLPPCREKYSNSVDSDQLASHVAIVIVIMSATASRAHNNIIVAIPIMNVHIL